MAPDLEGNMEKKQLCRHLNMGPRISCNYRVVGGQVLHGQIVKGIVSRDEFF